MVSLNGFDAREVKPSGPREPLPVGWYAVAITSSELKQNSKKTGSYLQLVLTVRDGEHKGRQVYERLNLTNDNPKAVEIAQETLSAICHATGVLTPNDSTDLHNLPFEALVKQKKLQGDTGERIVNETGGYRAKQSGATETPSTPPWAKAATGG